MTMRSPTRIGPLAAVTFAALTLGACATMNVNSFHSRDANLKEYRTYDWAADDRLETGDPRLDNNPFFLARVQHDVDKALAAKGFEKVADRAAMLIHYHAGVEQRVDLSNADPKYSENCNGCGPFVYDEGSLVIDFVDAGTGKLLWRGWAEGSIDGVVDRQDHMEEVVDRAVARILEKLPSGL
jgi:hypothetical protein